MRLAVLSKFLPLAVPLIIDGPFASAQTLSMQPFQLKLEHVLTAAQAKAELVKQRDLLAGDAPANLPKHPPTSCEQLIQRWDEWSTKIQSVGKFPEIAYNRAMVDCLTLKHLSSAKPSSQTVDQALAAMSLGTQLSGDFYPGPPRPATDYVHSVDPAGKDTHASLQLSVKGGEPGQTYRTYYIIAGATAAGGDEWFAAEQNESGTGTFADCGFVVIARGFDTTFSIRERRYLGRCE